MKKTWKGLETSEAVHNKSIKDNEEYLAYLRSDRRPE